MDPYVKRIKKQIVNQASVMAALSRDDVWAAAKQSLRHGDPYGLKNAERFPMRRQPLPGLRV
jgi:hypothetical protein